MMGINECKCYYCGKQMRERGEGQLIQMTEVGDSYYHLCGRRCKVLVALKRAVEKCG